MPSARQDYLLGLITQAAAALRRLRERLRNGHAADEIVRDADEAITQLLGSQRSMLEIVDTKTAAALLGHDERVDAWIDLLRVQSEALRASGNASQASKLEARTEALDNVVAPFRR